MEKPDLSIITLDPDSGGRAEDLTSYGDFFVFTFNNASNGREVWISDRTEEGTRLLKDINPGSGDATPLHLTVVGETLYFTADDGNGGRELWKSDGTTEGTVLVRDILPGRGGSTPRELTVLGDTLVFTADDGNAGTELWKSDGTPEGTVLIKDILPGRPSSYPNELTVLGDTLVFRVGMDLWKSDGTAEGTVLVKQFGVLSQLTAVGDRLFFAASDAGSVDIELWRSDGTTEGTILLKDINPGPVGSFPLAITSREDVGPLVFFSADDGSTGRELWVTNGTPEFTLRLKDFNLGLGSSSPGNLVRAISFLYYTAEDETTGRELHVSDGTEEGTRLVKDIRPGSESSLDPFGEEMLAVENELYFTPSIPALGEEVWVSDGTEAGTQSVADINPGSGSSFPRSFVTFYGADSKPAELWFLANDGQNGDALFGLNLADNGGTPPQQPPSEPQPLPDSDSIDAEIQALRREFESNLETLRNRLDSLEEEVQMLEQTAFKVPDGSDADETIVGSELSESIQGLAGMDSITGLGGNDFMNGNADRDSISAGDGDDAARGGANNDFVNGNAGNDFVAGDKGDDTINGGQNNDILNGNAGDDLLVGDQGSDIFILSKGYNRIMDFNFAEGDAIAIPDGQSFTLSQGELGVVISRDVGTTTLLGVTLDVFNFVHPIVTF